jgi:hypothetical protein
MSANTTGIYSEVELLRRIAALEAENEALRKDAERLLDVLTRLVKMKAPSYHDCLDNGESECEWCEARNIIDAAMKESK